MEISSNLITGRLGSGLRNRLVKSGVHVLTVKPVTYWAYEPELLDGLDTSRVYRSGSRDPQRIMHLLGVRRIKASAIQGSAKITDKFFPDSKVGCQEHMQALHFLF